MSEPTPVAEILGLLAAAFDGLRARWYLFGAQAVILWGRPRTSADIDVTVDCQPNDSPRLVRALGERGFELRIHTDVEEFRPKDVEDVRGVLAERASTLDLAEILKTLGLLEEALGQSDLRPRFEAELARAQRER